MTADRKLPNLSPSGFTTWERCQRRWWYEKVDGRKPPPSPAMALGTKVHNAIEGFLLRGVMKGDPDIVRIANAGLGHLAPLREGVVDRGGEVETAYKYPAGVFGPLPVSCKVDYIEPYHVTDHKTTSSLYGGWHKTPTQLAEDPQLLWYAYLGLREGDTDKGPANFEMQHIYFQTKGAAASRVLCVNPTWDDALRNRDAFVDASALMFDALDIERAEDVEGNEDACGDYGGCPHAPYCPIKKHTDTPGGNKPMGFRDLMKQRRAKMLEKANNPTGAPVPTAAPTPPPAGQMNPSDSPGVEDVTEKQLAEIADAVTEALGESASRDEARLWLRSRGRPELLRIGFGLSHIPRILDHMDGVAPVEPTEATPATDDDAAPRAGLFSPDVEPAGPLVTEAGETITADTVLGEADDPQDEHTVKVKELVVALLDYLQRKHTDGGRASKEDLKPTIRKITGRRRVDAGVWETWMYGKGGALAIGATAGFWDYGVDDSGMVWLTGGKQGDDEEVLSGPDNEDDLPPTSELRSDEDDHIPSPQAAEEDEGEVPDEPTPPPARASRPAPTAAAGWGATVFLVDALPQRSVPLTTLDELLGDYFVEVARGNGVLHYTLIDFAKGPGYVAASVIGDVREGRLAPVRGFVYVASAHPMTKHLEQMFPDALIIRGTR